MDVPLKTPRGGSKEDGASPVIPENKSPNDEEAAAWSLLVLLGDGSRKAEDVCCRELHDSRRKESVMVLTMIETSVGAEGMG